MEGDTMKSLILHPTEICQWHALVNEAQVNSQRLLSLDMESYLVFLLMRFSHGPELIESVLGLDFLDAMSSAGINQIERFKEVGDKSLLFSGLFPGLARKRHVSLGYFSQIGQTAYLAVSERYDDKNAELYSQLSHQFLSLQKVLQAVRNHPFPLLDISQDDEIISFDVNFKQRNQ